MILNFTSVSADDSCYHKKEPRKEQKRFLPSIAWFRDSVNLVSYFSVGVPEITEDQFFEDFSCINQIQAKKRGQINKEVCYNWTWLLCKYSWCFF